MRSRRRPALRPAARGSRQPRLRFGVGDRGRRDPGPRPRALVGQRTWGKGLVQSVYTLPYGAGLALTTAKYYTPSGRWIQRDYSDLLAYVNPDDHDGRRRGDRDRAAPEGGRGLLHRRGARGLRGRRHHAGRRRQERTATPSSSTQLLARNLPFNFAVELAREASGCHPRRDGDARHARRVLQVRGNGEVLDRRRASPHLERGPEPRPRRIWPSGSSWSTRSTASRRAGESARPATPRSRRR